MDQRPARCAACAAPMTRVSDPDLDHLACTACGSLFVTQQGLGLGEVGNRVGAELRLVPPSLLAGEQERACPSCRDAALSKFVLRRATDVVVDYCPACRGLFLDRGDLGALTPGLSELGPEQRTSLRREERGGRVVRLDAVATAGEGSRGHPDAPQRSALAGTLLELTVFLREPLGIGLRVSGERWAVKLAKLVGRFGGQDVVVGDRAFDRRFVIEATSADGARAVLHEPLRAALIALRDDPPRLFSRPGVVELLDDRLVAREGPYDEPPALADDAVDRAVWSLVEVATLIG